MNPNNSNFHISQDFEIVPHQKSKAYPISVKEWCFIKDKIKAIKIEVSNFHAIGYLLLGACASCLVTIIATDFKDDSSKYFCWALVCITLICGLLSIYFARDKQRRESAKPQEVITQMDLIEARFENIEKEDIDVCDEAK